MKKENSIRKLGSDKLFTEWFEEVYEANFERLYRYAFSITKSQQLAEDVVSEVFLNIWNKKPDYANIKELNAYLHVSVKHLAIRMISKDPQRFSYSTYDETMQISDTVDPENLLLGKELEKIIEKIIADLSPHSRIVYDMVKNKGYSYQKISEELGISKRTVESHMHNVLKKLKDELREHFSESDKTYNLFPRISSISVVITTLVTDLIG